MYRKRFVDALGDPKGSSDFATLLHRFTALFARALTEDQKMCLCGILAAEAEGLPDVVVVETRKFFQANIEWLTMAFQHSLKVEEASAREKAVFTLAQLEGALLVGRIMDEEVAFPRIENTLEKALSSIG